MNLKTIGEYVKSLAGSELSHPYGKEIDVYSLGDNMFALVEAKKPIRISLRCDKKLADTLKENYDEVMPGHKLNQNKWITIVLSGQLKDDEIKDLIQHSYQIVSTESL